MSRGDVVVSGVKQVKFREEDNIDLSLGESVLNRRPSDSDSESVTPLVGDVEIELEISAEFSPKASILAYYVRDDGEVVTASTDIAVEDCFPNPVSLASIIFATACDKFDCNTDRLMPL